MVTTIIIIVLLITIVIMYFVQKSVVKDREQEAKRLHQIIREWENGRQQQEKQRIFELNIGIYKENLNKMTGKYMIVKNENNKLRRRLYQNNKKSNFVSDL